MPKNHQETKKTPSRRGGSPGECQSRPIRQPSHSSPAHLQHIHAESLTTMLPGDILVLEQTDSLRSSIDSVFFAVLACPACGALSLITSRQYFGALPVFCQSKLCSCRFRIEDESRLTYLPVN